MPRHASPAEIRAAYLSKMKRLHPDVRPNGGIAGDVGEITSAYWQLKDEGRRAEQDRLLFGDGDGRVAKDPVQFKFAERGSFVGDEGRAPARKKAHPPRLPPRRLSRRLEALRTAAGLVACALGISGFVLAFTLFAPAGDLRARAEISAAKAGVAPPAQPSRRRMVRPEVGSAAADEFRDIVRRSGIKEAQLYGRQCLVELKARPNMTLLDYCLAFDDEAAAWERAVSVLGSGQRYFTEDQRLELYAAAAQELAPGSVRDALLTAAR
ncbi:MAG TPA: hypothetical protein VGB54_05055 [Allosphingosinicella sp.]